MSELTKNDLIRGHIYRGKRFREFLGSNNDRILVWVGGDEVQYDSDTVKDGRRYPRVPVEKFLKWADKDVTPQEEAD